MTANSGYSGSVWRCLAAVCAGAMMTALLPLGTAFGQEPVDEVDPAGACRIEPPQAGFADRETISDAHVRNVDCAASLNVVSGFEDTTYRPRLAVRRDQMASFIARGLDAAGVELPAGTDDQFTDMTTGPHRVNVNRLAEAGIVQGGPQDLASHEYGPGLGTRRDQMASFLMRAAGYALFDDPNAFADRFSAPAAQAFSDVPLGNTHFGNVNAAADAGLARGFAGGLYQAELVTTRDQMASFVVRLLSHLAVPTTVRITDQTAETVTVNQIITIVATVFDQYGNPAAETTTVTFSAHTTPPAAATVLTGTNGRAPFTFTSTEPGIVTVLTAIDGPGGNFTADGDSVIVRKEFRAEQPDEPVDPEPEPEPEPVAEQTFTTSGTFTVPEGVQQVTVAAWGAGGAGGVLFEPRGGGGGGSYCANTIPVAPGSQYTVTVGAGATPAQGDGQFSAVVGPGGVAVVGARGGGVGTHTGGLGGTTEDCPAGATAHPGGNGGNPAVGVARGGGGGGGSATAMGAGGDGQPGAGSIGGAGGDGQGAGGRGGDVESPGQSGIAPGGGGGGSGEGSTRSGSGANGQVVISWADGG